MHSLPLQYGQNTIATAPGSMPKTIGLTEEKGRESKEEWSTDVTEYSCCQGPPCRFCSLEPSSVVSLGWRKGGLVGSGMDRVEVTVSKRSELVIGRLAV